MQAASYGEKSEEDSREVNQALFSIALRVVRTLIHAHDKSNGRAGYDDSLQRMKGP